MLSQKSTSHTSLLKAIGNVAEAYGYNQLWQRGLRGGGNSTLFQRSGWQNARGANNSYSHNDRQVPDVAGAADNVAVYFQQQWAAMAGTSVAAPIWATGQALVNEDTIAHVGIVGYGPQLYYAVADENAGGKAYFDVTQGVNLYYPERRDRHQYHDCPAQTNL